MTFIITMKVLKMIIFGYPHVEYSIHFQMKCRKSNSNELQQLFKANSNRYHSFKHI